MGRPLAKRTLKSYQRELTILRRLAAAIAQDRSLNDTLAIAAIQAINRAIACISDLVDSLES